MDYLLVGRYLLSVLCVLLLLFNEYGWRLPCHRPCSVTREARLHSGAQPRGNADGVK